MRGSPLQLAVVFAFAAMIALFCLCVAYLTMLAMGRDAVLVGLAAMFAIVVFSVATSVVRMIRRRVPARDIVFGEVDQ